MKKSWTISLLFLFLYMSPLLSHANSLPPDDLFRLGETYYDEKSYEDAILAYEDFIKNYPNHEKIKEAMLKQALSFIALKDRTTANLILRKIMEKYPNSSEAARAMTQLGISSSEITPLKKVKTAPEKAGNISGQVFYRCNDKPVNTTITNYRVVLFQDGVTDSQASVLVDSHGKFIFSKLRPGSYSLVTTDNIYGSIIFTKTDVSFALEPGESANISLYVTECQDIKLIYPSANATVKTAQPTFKWANKSPGKEYIVHLERVGSIDKYMQTDFPPTKEYASQYYDDLTNGQYKWRVCIKGEEACSFEQVFYIKLASNAANAELMGGDPKEYIKIYVRIQKLFYADNDEKRQKEITQTLSPFLSRIVKAYIIPSLKSRGFTATYLGVQDQMPNHYENGTLLVDYHEEKGKCYGFTGISCDFTGVYVTTDLSLFHPHSETIFWERKVTAGNSASINIVGGLQHDALTNLEKEFQSIAVDIDREKWLEAWEKSDAN